MTKISFLHTGYPIECIAANIFVERGFEDHPYMRGTGFFAKRGKELYYITAKHCLEKHNKHSTNVAAGQLRIVAQFNKSNIKASDYVFFEEMIFLKSQSFSDVEEVADLAIFPIRKFKNDKQKKIILSRAVKIPPTGNWLDDLINLPLAKKDIATGNGMLFSCIGYPTSGTATDILNFKDNNDTVILQAAKFNGSLGISCDDSKLKMSSISWENDLDGFSGSPVFVGYKNEHGQHYALAGMLISGGARQTHFLKINVIAQAFNNP